MRSIFSTLLELAGFALVVAGAYLLAPWLGIAAAGVALLVIGAAVSA